jgi:hypothetical protein
MRRHVPLALGAVVLAVSALAAPAHAATLPDTVPASGSFAFTTGNGILPTWSSDDIVLIGVSPGSVTTSPSNLNARVRMPIVAKTGTANAAAGGFRLYNSTTLDSLRCSSPTIDTRANVIDCVLPSGQNAKMFAIVSTSSRSVINGSSTVTTIYRGMTLRINGQRIADMLSTTTFSPYVTVGKGDLVVTVDK